MYQRVDGRTTVVQERHSPVLSKYRASYYLFVFFDIPISFTITHGVCDVYIPYGLPYIIVALPFGAPPHFRMGVLLSVEGLSYFF